MVRNIKVGAILPAIKSARILAAVLKNIENYTVLSISKMETQFFWGYWLENSLLLEEDELDGIEDEIILKGERKLNVVLSGRKPECRWCKCRGHVKRNCALAKERDNCVKSGMVKKTKNVGGEEAEAEDEAAEVDKEIENTMKEEESGSPKAKKRRM